MTSIAPPQAVEDAIAPGETVKWWGAAPRGLRFRAADAFAIPVSIVWCAIVFSIVGRGASIGVLVAPFVAVGFWMLLGRFAFDAWQRSRMTYAVSDRAAYVIRASPFPLTRRFAGDALASVSYAAGSNGRGTLSFGPAPPVFGIFARRNAQADPPLNAFESVDGAYDVYELVVAAGAAP